ncbi:MULE domain-containing protein [Meloidogyne graminicola]|uniref:MULE domain-containing protein n=1 Tax=Meloidogyne graminicola TaxID=189291 RepID=A0A8S9ZVW2_9BILA|nr:MULE domain-containing protein [Meloidogyne graminicola]
MASFVKSKKGAEKLVFEGFIYVKCRSVESTRYWRCEFWRSGKCTGFAITDSNNNVKVTKQHNHGPSPTRIELARIKDRINIAATNSTLSARALVNRQLAGISDKAKTELPKLKNLEKTVGRKRFANGQHVPVPHTLSEICIPEQLQKTKTVLQENFLLADTGPEDNERIIMFASRTDLARLATCDVWVCDGTFWSAPALFYQIWIVHGRFRQSAVLPFVYCLLPSKKKECYKKALNLLLSKIDEINARARPKMINIDFEKGEEQAFRELIPSAMLHGCYFHYKQAIWRKIQALGWQAKYQDEAEEGFRNQLKMFAALTFVDEAHVRDWFRQLAHIFLDVYGNADADSPFVAFIVYMERTWIGSELIPARFPISMWNNRNITLDQMPRTTNDAESWHNVFSSIFHRHSPNPYNLLRALLDEQVRVDARAVRILSGEVIPQFSRPEYARANARLLNILKSEALDPIEYLTACSHYIRF